MQSHKVFDLKYNSLNAEQKLAVDTIEGPVMVVAGPGTGKTQILTLRIANILLKTQVNASNILALTFTQAAATNMKERLHAIIGHEAHHTNIFTFHAFCALVIEEHPDDFWDMLGMRLLDDVEKAKILEKTLDGNTFKSIKPFRKPYHYVPDAMRAIADLKREGVNPDELDEIIKEERKVFDAIPDKESTRVKGSLKGVYKSMLTGIERNEELQILYKEYQYSLSKENLYDYDDLIMSVLTKLRNDNDFRLRIMERYQYILVDEHQDSNNSQNKIINYLTSFHESPNIFVVGDEKQAIFRFQGASVENFRSFKTAFKDAKIITLSSNYRSHQTILDSAIQMLGTTDQGLVAQKEKSINKIQVMEVANPLNEISQIVEKIQGLLEEGVTAHEIAVITRTRAQAKNVVNALMDASVPSYADLSGNVLDEEITQKLLILLEGIHKYADDEAIFKVFHLDVFGLSPYYLYKLSQTASKTRTTLSELLSDVEKMKNMGIKDAVEFNELFTKLGHFYILSKNESLHTALHEIVRDSGFLSFMLKSKNPITATAPIRELFDQIASLDKEHLWKLSDLFAYLEKLREHHIKIKVGVKLEQKNKVQVVTAHSAKGLEYEVVFVPFVTDSVWGESSKKSLFNLPADVYGAKKNREESDDEADERRLFFVALTRAKKRIYLSYSTQTLDGKPTLLSRFVSSIKPEYVAFHKVEGEEKGNELVINEKLDDGKVFLEFVQSSFASYGMSVSALNNYLECPWKYFYTNLVRVPSGKEMPLLFGNAIHNALSMFFVRYKETGEKSCEYLLDAFELSCQKQSFTKAEMSDVIPKGREILTAYFNKYESEFPQNVRVKYRVPDVFLERESQNSEIVGEGSQSGIKLTGEIDLVEYLENSLTKVGVTDFKTGKAKTRNEILGKTKNADGNYYRQIVFYKILLSLAQPKWKMALGTLDFVEHDSGGKLHKETFEVTDDEVKKLKEDIFAAADDIQKLGFWNRFCDEEECVWCGLRHSLDKVV